MSDTCLPPGRQQKLYSSNGSEYTLTDGTTVKARSQFRYAWKGQWLPPGDAKELIKRTLRKTKAGKAFVEKNRLSIHNAAYGRPHPAEIKKITQALIDTGKIEELREFLSQLSNEQLIRKLQKYYGAGIDCAGYVQLAYIYAYTGSDNDPAKKRAKLGLEERRGNENLCSLSSRHFKKLSVLDAQTGDLLIMKARMGDKD